MSTTQPLRVVANDERVRTGDVPRHSVATDDDLLDAYSQAVITSSGQVSPAVVNIEVHHRSVRSARGREEPLRVSQAADPASSYAGRLYPYEQPRRARRDQIDVTLSDGRRHSAHLIGEDPDTDLACDSGRGAAAQPHRAW